MRIFRNKLSLKELAELQTQKMVLAEQAATIDYIAMMADIELPTEENIDAQHEVFED